MPYAAGLPGHAGLARRLVGAGLFRESLRPVRAWHARLGLGSPVEPALERSLIANTWVDWRLRALADEAARADWVDFEGLDRLEAAVASEQGVVLVITHVTWNALLRSLPCLRGREIVQIRQPKGHRFGAGHCAKQEDTDIPTNRYLPELA